MYFAILGRHPKLSLAEFALVPTTSIRRQGAFLFFASDFEESALLSQLGKLGGIVKWGVVQNVQNVQKSSEGEKGENVEKGEACHREAEQSEAVAIHSVGKNGLLRPHSPCSGSSQGREKIGAIEAFLVGVSLVGVNDQKLGMELKKIYGIKRFKLVELTSSDLEIKKEGKELIDLGSGNIGLVFGRQDIAHFELIDFEKPAHGMEVGMMPAKLAQMMVNIGIVERVEMLKGGKENPLTIYDPFCGFGTTGFVAHRLGHHFIGSDIVLDGAKKNAKRRENEKGITKNEKLHFTLFKHDVTKPFDHPVLKNVDVIVTEGWLGPVISKKTRESELLMHAKKIIQLYQSFLTHIVCVCPHVPLVITLPEYPRLPDAVFPDIVAHAVALGYLIDDICVYSRKGQEVCRRVVVMRR